MAEIIAQFAPGREHDGVHIVDQRQRFGGFFAKGVEAFLHRGDFVGMSSGNILFLIGIFGEVVEVKARRD